MDYPKVYQIEFYTMSDCKDYAIVEAETAEAAEAIVIARRMGCDYITSTRVMSPSEIARYIWNGSYTVLTKDGYVKRFA